MTTNNPENPEADLQREVKALSRGWHSIKQSAWSKSRGEALHQSIAGLSQACIGSGRADLADRALDIEVYLSSFIDSELRPDSEQLTVLEGLIEALSSQHRAKAPELETIADQKPADKPARHIRPENRKLLDGVEDVRTAFLLKSNENQFLELSQEFGKRGYVVEPMLSAASLITALGTVVPQVVLIDGRYATDLPDIENAAARSMLTHRRRSVWIVLSEEGGLSGRLAAMQSGADAYIQGPAKPETVVSRIDNLLAVGGDEPYKVMIIDDDRQQALYCDAILRRKGMSTQVCYSGKQALSQLDACHPDLIIVDLHMPCIDGLQFTAQVRDHPAFFTVPIIFLSGEQDPQKRYDALSLGGNDFLLKPIKPNHLLAAIWSRLKFATKLRGRLEKKRLDEGSAGVLTFPQFLKHAAQVLDTGSQRRDAFLLQISADDGDEFEKLYGATEIVAIQGHLLTQISAQLQPGDRMASRYCLSYGLLVHCQSTRGAVEFSDRLLAQISGVPMASAERTLTATFSIGICPLDLALRDLNQAIRMASHSCIMASDAGGNRTQLASIAELEPADNQDYLQALLETARDGELGEIQFQPLARLQGHLKNQFRLSFLVQNREGDWVDLSALVDDTIPPALVTRLDYCVLASAIQNIAGQGGAARVEAGVKISAGSVCESGFVSFLDETMKAVQFDARNLTLVFPLDDAANRESQLMPVIGELQRLGIRSCGSGFLGKPRELPLLERLPLFSVELASHLIDGDQKAIDSTQAMIRQVHGIGIQTVCGKVDSAAAMAQAWRIQADYAFGEFIQPAVSEPDFDFSQSFST